MYITWQQANDLHLLSTKIQPYDSILKPWAYTSLEGILGGLIRGGYCISHMNMSRLAQLIICL